VGNFFQKVPHENRILSAEPAGWWYLTAIGSISKSDTKKEKLSRIEKCCESFERVWENFFKSFPKKK